MSSVLIIDPSPECREVLATLLNRRGVRTWEVSRASEALDVLDRHRPGVVVVDLDSDAASASEMRRRFGQRDCGEPSSYVFLGRLRRGERDTMAGAVIAKPYHYGPLIRTIESLLGR